jgi:Spy/CpxP family protein refolding chaperone
MNKKKFVFFSSALLAAAIVTAQPQPPSNEEKLKHVSEKINKEIALTAAQKTKVEAAYKDFFIEMDKLRKKGKDGKPEQPPPPPPPPPGKKEDVDKLTNARDTKIKAALTAEQYKKYSEIEQTLRPPRPQGPAQRL